MNIEEQKKNFLNLLRDTYKAKKNIRKEQGYILSSFLVSESLDDYDNESRVKINENILHKYGFGGVDFWEIICPALKEEKYIEDFGDPNRIPVEHLERDIRYNELKKKLRELDEQLPASYGLAKALGHTRRDDDFYARRENGQRIKDIENEMESTEKELTQLVTFRRIFYPFFVVNEDRLFDENKGSASRTKFDSQNGVLRYGDIKHSFHRGNKGDKLLLRLFRKLWDERRYILNGVQKKTGQSFPAEALAVQVDVSKDKIISMLKSITRILQKGFPAEIERENGILLIVTEK